MNSNPILATTTAILLLAPACSAFEVEGIRVGNTPAAQIAKSPDIVGKGQYGKCLPFALDLHNKLRAAGIKSQVVGYHYEDLSLGGRNLGQSRGHAVVAYEDHGRTYLMDNQSWAPRWVDNASIATMTRQFGGMNVQVKKAFVVNKPVPRSHYNPSIGIDEASRRAMLDTRPYKKPAVAQAYGRRNET